MQAQMGAEKRFKIMEPLNDLYELMTDTMWNEMKWLVTCMSI